jgi:hypothetical protein
MIFVYYSFCDQFTLQRTATGLKAKIIQLLGIIARYYPAVVDETQVKKLKRWCMDSVTAQLNGSAKIEGNVISGYMDCMNSILFRDENAVETQSDESDKILNAIYKVLVAFQGQSRYFAPISALVLFKDHSSLFSNLILSNYQKLDDAFFYWASHHNPNAYKFGLGAYEEFIKRVSTILCENAESDSRSAITDNAILTVRSN